MPRDLITRLRQEAGLPTLSPMRSFAVPAMSSSQIAIVSRFEAAERLRPQLEAKLHHLIHAGIYHRTIELKAGTRITGALIKKPTAVTISGDAEVWLGGKTVRITGYAVLPASAHRKQVFTALADTWVTMAFRTKARTVEAAEKEFTDDWAQLVKCDGTTVITED